MAGIQGAFNEGVRHEAAKRMAGSLNDSISYTLTGSDTLLHALYRLFHLILTQTPQEANSEEIYEMA